MAFGYTISAYMVTLQQSKRRLLAQYMSLVALLVLATQIAPSGFSAQKLQDFAYANAAAVIGIGAAIAPNEYNTLAQSLEQKQTELTEREKELIAREEALGREYRETIAANNRATLLVVGGVSLVLILLILLNFYLDMKRGASRALPKPHEGELQTRL